MAHLSEDAALIAAFESGHDFHAATASRVFGVPATEVSPNCGQDQGDELRPGLRPVRLRARPAAAHHPDEARALMDDYFKEFGGVRDYLHEVVARARMDGYTATMMAGAATCPTSPRTTASARDGRTDGA